MHQYTRILQQCLSFSFSLSLSLSLSVSLSLCVSRFLTLFLSASGRSLLPSAGFTGKLAAILINTGHINKSVVVMPWENFSGRVPGTNYLTVLLTIMLCNMTTRADPQVVLVNLILWLTRTCSRTVKQSLDLVMVWNCCLANHPKVQVEFGAVILTPLLSPHLCLSVSAND